VKCRGHPLHLGQIIEGQVQEYIKNLRKAGAVISSSILLAVAEGVIGIHDSNNDVKWWPYFPY